MGIDTQWWGRTSLRRLALLLAGTVILAVFTLSSMFLAASKARSFVDEAGESSLSSTADEAEHLVLAYVGEAETVSRDMAGTLAVDDIPLDELDEELLGQLQVHTHVRAVTVTYPDGTFVVARRDGDGFVTRTVDPTAAPVQTMTTYDARLRPVSVSHEVVEFAILTAPSYLAAEESDGLQWTEPALRAVTKLPGVWATTAARDDNNQLVAVVAADIHVELLGEVLDGLILGEGGEAFILGADRSVIAAPPSHRDAITGYAADYGLVAPAAALGIYTTDVAHPGSTVGIFGRAGDFVTLERGLGEQAPPWVLHVQASPSALNPGAAQLATAFTVPLVAGLGAFLLLLWSAVVARSTFGKVRRRADSDPVSGLFSPKGLRKIAPRQARRLRASGRQLGVAVLVVDDLHELAIARGVFARDSAIHAVGEIIRLETGASDAAARSGMSEFVVMMSVVNDADAASAVERIRAHVADALELRFGAEQHLVVTSGYVLAGDGPLNIDELIDRAHLALELGDDADQASLRGPQAP